MGHAMKNLFAKMNMEPKGCPIHHQQYDFGQPGGKRDSASPSSRKAESATLPHVEQLAFFTVDNPPFSVPLLLLYKKNSIISPHAKDFIDMVKEYYRNLEEKKIKA